MNIIKLIFRYYKLLLIESLLGENIVPGQEKWLAEEYKKLLKYTEKK